MTSGTIQLDLHGKNQYQAKIAIEAQLRRASRGVYRLRVIHGCHQGTALRDMIRQTYASDSRILRLDCSAPGSTDMILREY